MLRALKIPLLWLFPLLPSFYYVQPPFCARKEEKEPPSLSLLLFFLLATTTVVVSLYLLLRRRRLSLSSGFVSKFLRLPWKTAAEEAEEEEADFFF